MKKAFTLAEILIVLVIIGVLTMILLPVAFQSSPDEDVMKFKKGYNTLGTVIRELVSSDKYYQNGDLGTRANGTVIDGKHDGDYKYFCESIADTLSTKKVNCSETNTGAGNDYAIVQTADFGTGVNTSCSPERITQAKELLDSSCKQIATITDGEIVTTDNITYFEGNPVWPYGIPWGESLANGDYDEGKTCMDVFTEEQCNSTTRLFSDPNGVVFHMDCNGFDRIYKVFCMDIDEKDKGEDPFGFGIRADGKILTGARADEWMDKKIQKK